MSTIATISAVSVNGTVYRSTGQFRYGLAREIVALYDQGNVDPAMMLNFGAAPGAVFSTYAIGTFLSLNSNLFATRGLPLSSTGFLAWLRQRTADAGLSATGDQLAIANGIIYPARLSVATRGAGLLECAVMGRSSDGLTNPLIITADQSVGVAAGVAEAYSLGRVERNGVEVPGIQLISYDPGISVEALPERGHPYPENVHLTVTRPRFMIDTLDADMADLFIDGLYQDATDTEVFLRAWDPAGGRKADNQSVHVKFTIPGNGSVMSVEEIAANQQGNAVTRIVYDPLWDGTNPIVQLDAAAVIA